MFRYGDRVRVTSGFFEGMEGKIRDIYSDGDCLISFYNKERGTFETSKWVKPKHLELVERTPVCDERLISIEQHGLDSSWLESFWDTLVAGVTTLWDEFVYCIRAIPGMHTPSSTWPSSQQSNTALLAPAKAIEDEINDVVDIDYEQPQSMYPELPYEEVTE